MENQYPSHTDNNHSKDYHDVQNELNYLTIKLMELERLQRQGELLKGELIAYTGAIIKQSDFAKDQTN